ncbi:MAG: cell surface protein [Acidobacteria bacterium]|nr:cell surface protein [Acidobacteriota bacterium]
MRAGNAILAVLLLAGPGRAEPDSGYRSPATLVADVQGQRLYVAEYTARRIAVVGLAGLNVLQEIALPERPNGLVLSADGTRLYVTAGAASGSVQIIDTAKGAVTGAIAAGYTPMAPVLSRDGGTLYVSNRHNNNVSVIDLRSKTEVARIPVKREPDAAGLSADGNLLFVANQLPAGPASAAHVAAVVSVIDTRPRRVTGEIVLPDGSTGLRGLCFSPDGRFVYLTHLLARYRLPATQIERGWIQTNAVSVIDAARGKLVSTFLLDDINMGAANPWGVACTEDGKYLCVAHAGTHEVSVIDRLALHRKLEAASRGAAVSDVSAEAAGVENDLAFLTGIRTRVPLLGNGPRGIVAAGASLYTAEYFTGSLGIIGLSSGGHLAARSVPLGETVAPSAERRGEMLFHDAQHAMEKWLSCASCHQNEGRPDGLNWDLLLDAVGNPKNTKSLLLAHQTPPTTVTGIRPNAEASVRSGLRNIEFADRPEEEAQAIDAYLKSLQPLPSPRLENGRLSASAERGKKLFGASGCPQCHAGRLRTGLEKYNVGTGRGREKETAFDTPTLIEVWRTGPYLHDGRAATILDVFNGRDSGPVHGLRSKLREREIRDLAAFILSL